ncbi:MAG TPA: hypothetical protein VGA52_03815 [Anaerolineales bacterium]
MSWIDRLQNWVDRLGIPYVAPYVIAGGLVGLGTFLYLGAAGAWIQPSGLRLVASSWLWISFPLISMHLTNRLTSSAYEVFRPALDLDDDESASLRNQLVRMPAGPLWLACLSVAALTLAANLILPAILETYLPDGTEHWPLALLAAGGYFVVGALIFHSTTLLTKISNLYQFGARLTVLYPERTYAFSTVSSAVALSWGVLIYSSIALLPELITNPVYSLVTAALVAVIAGTVLSWLFRVNRQLSKEKLALRQEVIRKLQSAYESVDREFESGNLESMAALRGLVQTLQDRLAFINELSTWPWRPGTVAGVVSALLLPAVIVLIQEITRRVIG